jgi:hypothetical protein
MRLPRCSRQHVGSASANAMVMAWGPRAGVTTGTDDPARTYVPGARPAARSALSQSQSQSLSHCAPTLAARRGAE